jgi:hypothetical protein
MIITAAMAFFALLAGALLAGEIRDAFAWVARRAGFTLAARQPVPPPLSREELDDLCRTPVTGRVIDRDTAGFAGWDVIDAEISQKRDRGEAA